MSLLSQPLSQAQISDLLDKTLIPKTKSIKLSAQSEGTPLMTSGSQPLHPLNDKSTDFDLVCRAVALTVVSGLNAQQAGEFLNMSAEEVMLYKENPRISDYVNRASALASLSPEQRIARSIPTIIDKKLRVLLTSKDDKLVMAVGTEMMDRHYGKPVQTTQSFGVNVMAHTSIEDLQAKQLAVSGRLAQIERERAMLKQVRPIPPSEFDQELG